MNMTKVLDIVVKERIREDFGDIMKLAESIKKVGLIHPIVVQPTDDGKFKLVAGERRLRACTINGMKEVPTVEKTELNEFQLKEIELEENLHRKDLSWQEEVEATRQLDELKRIIYGTASQGTREGWGIEDTADSLGVSQAKVSRDLSLAKELKDNPALAEKLKNVPKAAAYKLIVQEKKAAETQLLLDHKKFDISVNLINDDAVSAIDQLEDNSIDLLLTDPPYGYEEIKVRDDGSDYNSYTFAMQETGFDDNVSTPDEMWEVYVKLMPKLYNKMKEGSYFFILTGGPAWFVKLYDLMLAIGFEPYTGDLVWDKGRPTSPWKATKFMRSHVLILYGIKPPRKRLLAKPARDVLQIAMENPMGRVHPLQITELLWSTLIEQATNVGDVVLDPFAGSGSTLIAAKNLKRHGIGFELSKQTYLNAMNHIAERLGVNL